MQEILSPKLCSTFRIFCTNDTFNSEITLTCYKIFLETEFLLYCCRSTVAEYRGAAGWRGRWHARANLLWRRMCPDRSLARWEPGVRSRLLFKVGIRTISLFKYFSRGACLSFILVLFIRISSHPWVLPVFVLICISSHPWADLSQTTHPASSDRLFLHLTASLMLIKM